MLYVLGKVGIPERSCQGWSIRNLLLDEEKNEARMRMDNWLKVVAKIRASLNQKDMHLVFQMLETNGSLRIKAAEIKSQMELAVVDKVSETADCQANS